MRATPQREDRKSPRAVDKNVGKKIAKKRLSTGDALKSRSTQNRSVNRTKSDESTSDDRIKLLAVSSHLKTRKPNKLASDQMPVRLQRYLAACGVSSRRAAEELIARGKVSVNSVKVKEMGIKVTPGVDIVSVEGRRIELESPRVFLFYKPDGVVTTARDTHGRKCLTDYVQNLPVRVFPVGRLDMDVSGLLILTNDGQYSQELQHPKYGVVRVYWALVRGIVEPRTIRQLERGIQLADGPVELLHIKYLKENRKTRAVLGDLPANHTLVEVALSEGRNHLVKRLFTHVHHPVIKLCRVSYGPYKLEMLVAGEIREVRQLSVGKKGNQRSVVQNSIAFD